MRKHLACCLIFSILFSSKGHAQADTVLGQKLWNYISQHPVTNLFVHTDKNIYSPNERIWFKAYVLSGPIIDNKVLYVRLLDANKNRMLSAAYPMYDVRSHGDLLLPDTLKDGDYFLYAYADRMINFNPADVFIQPIRIHKNSKRWRATAYVRDTSKLKRGEKAEIIVRLMQNNDLVKGVKGHYQLMDGGKVIKQGGLKTNLVGEAFIEFTYPQLADDHTLTARMYFEDDNDFEEVMLTLGHEGNTVSVNVFPEGGHAVEGVANNMAVTVTDVNENGVEGAVFTVYGGKEVIATAATNALGMGTFTFIPQADMVYGVEVMYKGKKQHFPFPVAIETKGYVLKVGPGNGKPQCRIYNRNSPEEVVLIARSFEQICWSKKITVPQNKETIIDLPIDTFPKEMIAVNLLDTGGNTLAERLCMNKEEEPCTVQITCDKTLYGKRKKITVTLTAKNEKGLPVKLNSSVSIAEIHSIDTATIPQITDRFYYKNLGAPPLQLSRLQWSTKGINDLMITRKWAGFNWHYINDYKPGDGIRIFKNTDGVYGRVEPLNKKKKLEIKDLPIVSKEGILLATLDESGTFNIPSEVLISPRNNLKNFMLGTSFHEKYKITFRRYDEEFDKMIMQFYPLYPLPQFTTFTTYKMQELEHLTSPHQLQTVVVRKTKDNPWNDLEYKSTTCADWVCMFNILNCPNHATGNVPVEGEIYTYRGEKVVYRSCGKTELRSVIPLKLVYTPNKFLMPDYDKDASREEDFRSTLFWEPNLNTGADGKASFSFFTNDISSTFIIRLQGITAQGFRPVYSTQQFIVK